MNSLPRVQRALREVHKNLEASRAVGDLRYIVDVDPYGVDCLVVYIEMAEGAELDVDKKRAIESAIRGGLAKAIDYDVYFRWYAESERRQDGEFLTTHGLLDEPVSAFG